MRSLRLCPLLVSVSLVALVLPRTALCAAPDQIDFNRDVRPLLSDRCFFCHGPDPETREADLRIDQQAAAHEDRGGYAAIVPGKPNQSELIARITESDADLRMPPVDSGKTLSAEEIEILRRWIAQGGEYSEPWAYVAPVKHAPPQVKQQDWPAHWIDHFVLARLEQEGVRPSAEADRVTLIRRLYFDLIGLPPTPEAVDAFVADTSPNAYEKLVDRLLASPRFGERLAIYWLDLVRYADTVGYHGDQTQNISPYRDWVIDALNDNMPFDDFTRAQLAGDLLPEADIEAKIASGYNRMLQTSHEGGVQPKEYLAIYAADRIRNLSNVWMGATMGCCQCHDHKYDPYTIHDFYSMVAFFADIDEAQHFRRGTNSLPTARPPELVVLSRADRARADELAAQVAAKQQEHDALPADSAKRKTLAATIKQLKTDLAAVKKRARRTMITVATKPRTIRVLPRGNWLDDSGPVVEPAIPEFLGSLPVEGRPANRLDLANWLLDAENGAGGLTARVFANRFWYLMFGEGLARVLDDFGGQGQPPTHPKLLDRLAVEFVESGWDVKHLFKQIAMSRAYRQASVASDALRARDPDNRLFARQGQLPLPAEIIRDNALAVSGLLVLEQGGPAAKPYQPAGYYRHLNFPKRSYRADNNSQQWRRGVYVHWQRQFLHPMLKAFDAPSREECTAARPRSNTPIAALTLLNDPTFIEAARVFAERILREGGDSNNARLDFAVREVLSRTPDAEERAALSQLLAASREEFAAAPKQAAALLAVGIAPHDKSLPAVDVASWTNVARAILNLNETITRN